MKKLRKLFGRIDEGQNHSDFILGYKYYDWTGDAGRKTTKAVKHFLLSLAPLRSLNIKLAGGVNEGCYGFKVHIRIFIFRFNFTFNDYN